MVAMHFKFNLKIFLDRLRTTRDPYVIIVRLLSKVRAVYPLDRPTATICNIMTQLRASLESACYHSVHNILSSRFVSVKLQKQACIR